MTIFGVQQEGMISSGIQQELQHGMEQLSMTAQLTDAPVPMNLETHSVNVRYDNRPARSQDCVREADETDEQYKERILNDRAANLFADMKPKLSAGQHLSFTELAPKHNTKKEVAQKFYSLLILKKQQVLKIEQNESYVPVTICKGSRFETDAN